jgi:hypothetical protein
MGRKQIILSIEGTDVSVEKLIAAIRDSCALYGGISLEVRQTKVIRDDSELPTVEDMQRLFAK